MRAIRIERALETSVSALVFLEATYSADAPDDLPRHLVVKSPAPTTFAPDASTRELEFYRRLASAVGSPPLVRCLAAIGESDGLPDALVLQDLRSTHDHPPWPLPPSRTQTERALDALALLHARWWEDPALGHTIGHAHTTASLTSMVQGIAAHLPAFLDALGDAIPVESRRVYERVFGSALGPWMRLTDPRALTVTHGDAHSWNFLFPRVGDGPARLIDWQLWHIDVGARDLAFLMALHWYPGRRHELELRSLRHYHGSLLARGVTGYAFDDLWLDYRRGVVRNLTFPILFWSRGMQPEGWFHRLECAMAAYHDLACDELL